MMEWLTDVDNLYMLYTILALLIIPIAIFGFIAQIRIMSAFKKYKKVFSQKGITGAQFAFTVFQKKGMSTSVNRLPAKRNELENYFDPRNNSVSLSDVVFSSSSLTSLGVSAHEVGHAIQTHDGYTFSKIRRKLVPIVNIGTKLAMPILLIGVILMGLSIVAAEFAIWFVLAGVIMYGLSTLFMLVTLPVEFNASRRAMIMLEETGALVGKEELGGARKVLNAAAMTYVASFLISLIYFLMFAIRLAIVIASSRK